MAGAGRFSAEQEAEQEEEQNAALGGRLREWSCASMMLAHGEVAYAGVHAKTKLTPRVSLAANSSCFLDSPPPTLTLDVVLYFLRYSTINLLVCGS